LTTKEQAVATRQRTVSHFHFTIAFLTKTNMTVVPTHHTFLFPRLEIKQKGRHFETTEVIEAESQAVLNSLTQNTTSRMHLKMAHALVMVANRPIVR
jgi:hypothetical protein